MQLNMKAITKSLIESSAIKILQSLTWEYAKGMEISLEGVYCERERLGDVILVGRLRNKRKHRFRLEDTPSARVRLMVLVRRTLLKHYYPAEKQETAIEVVMQQAEMMKDGVVQ
jgi:Domain of unknown function (DUF3387)